MEGEPEVTALTILSVLVEENDGARVPSTIKLCMEHACLAEGFVNKDSPCLIF